MRLVLRLRVEREDAPARRAGVSKVLVQTSRGRAQSRCRCGTAGVSPAVGPGANPGASSHTAQARMPQGCRTAPVTGRRSLVVLFWPAGWMACSAVVGWFGLPGRWNVCSFVWFAYGMLVCLFGWPIVCLCVCVFVWGECLHAHACRSRRGLRGCAATPAAHRAGAA